MRTCADWHGKGTSVETQWGQVSVASCPGAALVRLTWRAPFISWRDPASVETARRMQQFTQSDCSLLELRTCPAAWTGTQEAAAQAYRPCSATQELSLGARSRSYNPPGYWGTQRGQTGRDLEVTDPHLHTEQGRAGLLRAEWSSKMNSIAS